MSTARSTRYYGAKRLARIAEEDEARRARLTIEDRDLVEQTMRAVLQTREDEARITAEGLTLELAQPLRPEQMGGKPATDQQPGLFGPQQRRLFE